MQYICTNCHYIYDESIWDKEEWINEWTHLSELWDNFLCPNCSESIDFFYPIKEEVNYIKWDINDFMEMNHYIKIKQKEEKIKILIWIPRHPQIEEHKITEISLYDEYWELIEDKFLFKNKNNIVYFDISNLDEYEIRIRCSLHWVWWIKINNN